MNLNEQIQDRIIELRTIVQNFRVVGSGISGSFNKGYELQQPDNIDPDKEVENPLPDFGQAPFV